MLEEDVVDDDEDDNSNKAYNNGNETTMPMRRYSAMVKTMRRNGKMGKRVGYSNFNIIFGATRTTT